MEVLGFIGLIIGIILCIIGYKKIQNTNEINKKIEEENKKLLKDKEDTEKEIKFLIDKKEETKKDLAEIEKITSNMNAAAHAAFAQYCESLEAEYKDAEKEHDDAIDGLRTAYDQLQDILMYKTKEAQKELDKISATRAAALEAQLKEQEIKDKLSFYCPQVSEADLKDAKTLHDIEYKLNNPRILRMLIWQSYYQKPMNQVCANVLGASAAGKCGIYKITNQLNDLVYIGQAVDMSTRWKNHAKAGLGIDTPVGNKLYKAMAEDGLENFSFEMLEECPRDELDEKERYYIGLYQADQFGYNSNKGIDK